MKRDEFYARVRDAAAAGRAYRVTNDAPHPARVGYVGGGDDLPARLAEEIQAVGGEAVVVDDQAAARAALAALLERYQPQSALCWEHPVLARLGLDELLAARGIAKLDYATLSAATERSRAEMLAADIGITSVSLAIAETGSLVMMSAAGCERVASLLPPVHVAIVESTQIVPDLFDAIARLDGRRAGDAAATGGPAAAEGDLPSNVAFITGPSKTGDIELTLTTGVHGPGRWHVIVIR